MYNNDQDFNVTCPRQGDSDASGVLPRTGCVADPPEAQIRTGMLGCKRLLVFPPGTPVKQVIPGSGHAESVWDHFSDHVGGKRVSHQPSRRTDLTGAA